MSELRLAHGLRFEDLYEPAGLAAIDGHFVDALKASDEGLLGRLLAAPCRSRHTGSEGRVPANPRPSPAMSRISSANSSPIQPELKELQARHSDLAPLFSVKRLFVQRRALKAHREAEVEGFDADCLAGGTDDSLRRASFDELTFARHVEHWLANDANYARGARPRRPLRRLGGAERGREEAP